jgi:diguanylate cyclase (GGDEF)-like protein
VCRDADGDDGCHDLAERSGEWLASRSRKLAPLAQFGPVSEQPEALVEMELVLAEARRRGDRVLFLPMLVGTVGTRVASAGAGHRAEHLIAELLEYARRHGLWLHEANAYAALGRQAVFAGQHDAAVTHMAAALAILDRSGEPYPWLPEEHWQSALGSAMNMVALILAQLGLFEQAAPLLESAERLARQAGRMHALTVDMVNRVRLLLGWSLRLERAGQRAEAADRLATAAGIARAVEQPWPHSQLPGRERPAAEVEPVVGAAHALADPGPRHLDVLYGLRDRSLYARERITVAIATARCLDHDGHREQGLQVLRDVRDRLVGDASEPSLAVSLAYEIARHCASAQAKWAYAEALEAELWRLHEARVATVHTGIEHVRLDQQHRRTVHQALRDPLTGLPNRRALDEALAVATSDPGWAPLAVAVVDLDHFKSVNDRDSHAAGDAVLRTVAHALRTSLRCDDMVARHGGDEFVILLPRTTLPAAEATLTRAARAVATLPADQGRGVTVSIGVTTLRTGEPAETLLKRADTAMYTAKRHGGNLVQPAAGTDIG